MKEMERPRSSSTGREVAGTSPREEGLPPGQREIDDFPRFGLPQFAGRLPSVPLNPAIRIDGEVDVPCEIGIVDVQALPRVELVADFHCVTTWTRRNVAWSGVRMRDFYEQLVTPRARPTARAKWLLVRGLDGYRVPLLLDDVLVHDVLLADRLDGEPLSLDHGAPIRMVAPAHYGFKAVKHLCAINLAYQTPKGSGGWRAHPRGRVALEERGAFLPGWVYRPVFRAAIPFVRRHYRRAIRRR